MPKKTKKEKLLASYHRKLRLLENRQAATSPPVQVKISTPISKPTVKVNPRITVDELPTQELKEGNQYFFSDLRKSLLLIVLILGIEVSLYIAKLVK